MSRAPGPGVPLDLPRTRDGRPILTLADLQRYDMSPRRSGRNDQYYCPFHGSDHKQSLSVNRDTGLYRCWVCQQTGMIRDFWEDKDPYGGAGATGRVGGAPSRRRPAPLPPTFAEVGRRKLESDARVDTERAERLAADPPPAAAAFLARLPTLVEALRGPDNAGAAYLRGRGLDPAVASALGVGYAAPNQWPGDRGRRVGRLVYPLADPMTGRVVGALGRLCTDPSDGWSDEARAAFRGVKQRKLTGCPAGVWPHMSIAAVVEHGRPLVIVEGPADALALLQRPQRTQESRDVVALCGTANVLPAASLRRLPGVVLALDGDGPGATAAAELRVQCALAGVRTECLPASWLGDEAEGAKDAGELAGHLARGEPGADEAYDRAVAAVAEACTRVQRAAMPVWDQARAEALIGEMLERCNVLYEAAPEPRRREALLVSDAALDEACVARDWTALVAAITAYEGTLADLLLVRAPTEQDELPGTGGRITRTRVCP